MDLYTQCLQNIQSNAEIKKSGKFNGIPYPYPRFSRYVPSVDKEQVTCVTSFSGAAKSKFCRYTYLMHPYEFSLHNDYKLEIDVLALEDSAIKIFKNILCSYLNLKHKINISLFDLDSKFRELPSSIMTKLKEGERYLQDFNNRVRIIDNIANPYGIYKYMEQRAKDLGEVVYETKNDAQGVSHTRIVGFKPKDDTHWLTLVDNLNNIEKEKQHLNAKEAMDLFVQKDCRLLYSKIYKQSVIIIHQQALEAERQQFTNTGGFILERIKPSLANLGGTKEVVRSYHLVLSLFNPHKFKIEDYKGYNTKLIGNNFRELEVLKSNDGFDNIQTPLYFDGAAEYFRELPNSEKQKQDLEKFYEWLEKERASKGNQSLLF